MVGAEVSEFGSWLQLVVAVAVAVSAAAAVVVAVAVVEGGAMVVTSTLKTGGDDDCSLPDSAGLVGRLGTMVGS